MEGVVSPKLLSDDQILLGLDLRSPEDLFAAIGKALGRGDPWQTRVIHEGLATRHRRATVAVGRGLAIPRAAVPGITRSRAVYVRSTTPINMRAPDNKGVTDALALVVPKPGFDDDYRVLMRVMEAALAEHFVERIRTAQEPQEVLRLLTRTPL